MTEWETVAVEDDVDGNTSTLTSRLPVPGGWLYLVQLGDVPATAITVCFVPGRSDHD